MRKGEREIERERERERENREEERGTRREEDIPTTSGLSDQPSPPLISSAAVSGEYGSEEARPPLFPRIPRNIDPSSPPRFLIDSHLRIPKYYSHSR